MTSRSPLRYPGGKTRACKKLDEILVQHFHPDQLETLVSPFFGGGSFEFYLQTKYNLGIIANDKFQPLYNFWHTAKSNQSALCANLTATPPVSKEKFQEYRKAVMTEKNALVQAEYYFIINRCSFSGATLSGGFSEEASQKRFTPSSIEKLHRLDLTCTEFFNLDFADFIDRMAGIPKALLFLDPPYYLEKGSKLYGDRGDMHETFDHIKLHEKLKGRTGWLLTYNNCEYIRQLYKDFLIIPVNWSYGMNKSKESSEIVILCP
jgi:DNA adenine methylase